MTKIQPNSWTKFNPTLGQNSMDKIQWQNSMAKFNGKIQPK
jgi:hypothetical protein